MKLVYTEKFTGGFRGRIINRTSQVIQTDIHYHQSDPNLQHGLLDTKNESALSII